MTELIPGMLVKFRVTSFSGDMAARWPAGFNESGTKVKELGPSDVGLYVSNCKNPEYAKVLVDETVMIVRKTRIVPY